MAQGLQLFQRNHGLLAKRADRGPAQRADMAETAQSAAHIPGQRPDIGSLAAFGLAHGMVGVRGLDQLQPVDLDRAGGFSSTVSPSRARS